MPLDLRPGAARRRQPWTFAPLALAPLALLALLSLPGALAVAGPPGSVQNPAEPPHFMGALMSGMVILMVPSFLVCLGITIMVYRRHKRSTEE